MATLTQISPAGGVSGSAHFPLSTRIRSLFAHVSAWIESRRRQDAILGELAQLEDRDLRDLSISRYDFAAISRGTFQR